MEKKIASNIIKEIKGNITEMKKKRPNESIYSVPLSMVQFMSERICISFYNSWKGETLADNLTRYQAKKIAEEVIKGLKELKATRGWGRLMWEIEDCCNGGNGWYNDYIKFPTNIVLMAEPCKEYKSLVNYLSKYCGKNLNDTDIYSVHIGGKRGRVYGEEGDRYYLCHNSALCEKILADLRKYRGSNDKVVCTNIKEHDDIDKWELEVSIRNEVEFGGVRNKYFEVKISTPSGKEKKTIIIGRR
jgi:hypothetical protein